MLARVSPLTIAHDTYAKVAASVAVKPVTVAPIVPTENHARTSLQLNQYFPSLS
jgi:hypothetical protein